MEHPDDESHGGGESRSKQDDEVSRREELKKSFEARLALRQSNINAERPAFQRSKVRQHAFKLRTRNEKPMHNDPSPSEEGLDNETCSPLSKKRKMDGGDHASSSSLKMQVEEARDRQRKDAAAEREAKLIKLREEKSLSLGPEPEKGPDVTKKQRGRPRKDSKKRRGRPPTKIVDKPVEPEPIIVEPASDPGRIRKRGRPRKASKQDFDMAPPCLDSEHYKAKLRSYEDIFQDPLLGEPTCSSLLVDLKIIWDQVGESYEERGKMLLEIKEECLSAIKRKVEHAKKSQARLLQALADAKLEFSTLLASLGDKSSLSIPKRTKGCIKDQLADIESALQLLKKEEILKNKAEVGVERLTTSKMKDIMLRRQWVLDDILGRAHIETNTQAAIKNIMFLIDSGSVEPSKLLAEMDAKIIKAKEEALSRKEILDKINVWFSDCNEEEFLRDYDRGDSEQLDHERAEKARILGRKIPALVDTLVSKTQTWEEEHGRSFKYNGAPLLAMLNDYLVKRREREKAKRVSPKPTPACPLSQWTKMDGPRGNMGSNCGQIKRLFTNAMYDTEPG